jgi:glycerate 2-kinase
MSSEYSVIKNYFQEGLKAVNPINLIDEALSLAENKLIFKGINNYSETINLDDYEKIMIIGAGKASASMAKKVEQILGERITGGVIVNKYGFGGKLSKLELIEAGHPVPDQNGIRGAKRIMEECENAGTKDLIINLLSGGASALLPFPSDGITLNEKAETTNTLLKSGATIDELNTIRKHLSKIKGGKLLAYAYPAKIISLILSDVIGDKLEVIGSGISVPDNTTYKDCIEIVEKYNFQMNFPKSVLHHLSKGYKNELEKNEVSKNNLKNVSNFIIGNNSVALKKINDIAVIDGYKTKIMDWNLEGESRIVAAEIVENILTFINEHSTPRKKYCFLYGGETSVTIKGEGTGGRNQELVLSAAIKLNKIKGITFLSGGTDGNDGPTNAAGAICNYKTVEKGKKLGLNADEYLERNDSYNYFKKIDSLLVTGPTGTNVMDLQIVLIET